MLLFDQVKDKKNHNKIRRNAADNRVAAVE